MPTKKPAKGDVAIIKADIAKVWENGLVTLHLPGYDHPVTVHEKFLDDIQTKPKPPKPVKQPKHSDKTPMWDDPDNVHKQ
ncbi:hypothetical protein MZK49_05580 [Ensifer sesbaniae]|uniref:hypothetical protein n=1 Tax=Ensifer sesbaniae TaxID=1214071 RepID=UPI0020010D3D|nr:hypothetical protein [Ensifer sesbaniae]